MTEFLLAEIGRREVADHYETRDSYVLSAGIALGLISLGRGSDVGLSDLNMEDRLHQFMTGGKYQSGANPVSTKCSRLKEGRNINIQMTAPGATLALGFMFMKTNSTSVAARLAIPDTLFLLDYVKPDLMLLRVLAKNLVLWDSIQPSIDWVSSQLPSVVAELYLRPKPSATHDTIVQAHANILAGGCFALGLRFAGTASSHAKSVLLHFLAHFVEKRQLTCIGVVGQALGFVMAGTGDLESLRALRHMRLVAESGISVTYGQHMAYNAAIGMVFLGGGTLSFTRTKEAIAALVIACYPKFPITPTDNVFHLQPLRNLYTLATESRYLQAIDVDTKQPCFVPIVIHCRDRTSIGGCTPCAIPSFDCIAQIATDTARYYRLQVDCDGQMFQTIQQSGKLFVKRKSGNLSYAQDAHGLKSLMARAFPKEEEDQSRFLSCFTEDPTYVVFGKYFALFPFCTSILYECLAKEKPEMLMTYLAMHQAIQCLPSAANSSAMANLQLLLRFAKKYNRLNVKEDHECLIQIGFIESCIDRLHQYFFSKFDHDLSAYLKTGKWIHDMVFACFLTYLDAPLPVTSSGCTLSDVLSLSVKNKFTPTSTWIQVALVMEQGDYY